MNIFIGIDELYEYHNTHIHEIGARPGCIIFFFTSVKIKRKNQNNTSI